MGDITKFYPKNAAINPDAVLEKAVGTYETVLIIGWDKEGLLDVRSNSGLQSADMLLMIEIFKRNLLDGDYSEFDD